MAPWSAAATSNAQRVRVEAFSKIRAMLLPESRGTSRPSASGGLEVGGEVDELEEAVPAEVGLGQERAGGGSAVGRAGAMVMVAPQIGVPADGAAHAAGSAAAASELVADQRHDLDAVVGEQAVGVGVALVAEDDAGCDREVVVGVVPLLALGRPHVLRRPQHADVVALEHLGQGGLEPRSLGDLGAVRFLAGREHPHPRVVVRQVGVGDEGRDVDHRQHGVEVHGRACLGELDREDPSWRSSRRTGCGPASPRPIGVVRSPMPIMTVSWDRTWMSPPSRVAGAWSRSSSP